VSLQEGNATFKIVPSSVVMNSALQQTSSVTSSLVSRCGRPVVAAVVTASLTAASPGHQPVAVGTDTWPHNSVLSPAANRTRPSRPSRVRVVSAAPRRRSAFDNARPPYDTSGTTRIAVLDDYIGIAKEYGDWAALGDEAEITFYREAIPPNG